MCARKWLWPRGEVQNLLRETKTLAAQLAATQHNLSTFHGRLAIVSNQLDPKPVEDNLTNTPDPTLGDAPPAPPLPQADAVSDTADITELRSIVKDFVASTAEPLRAIPHAIRALELRTSLLKRLFWVTLGLLILDICFTFFVSFTVGAERAERAVIAQQVARAGTTQAELRHATTSRCLLYRVLLLQYVRADASPQSPEYQDALTLVQRAADGDGCHLPHVVPGA